MSRTKISAPLFRPEELDPSIVDKLSKIESTIRRNTRSSNRSVRDAGLALLDAKNCLEHGQFNSWVLSQCGFSIRTAERYMRAAEFLDDKYDTVSHLQPSTIYQLSAKNIPDTVLEQVFTKLAEAGRLSDNQVNSLIDQLLSAARPEPEEPSDAPPDSALIAAWNAASAPERHALLTSDRAAFIAGTWQLMPPEERAAFVAEHRQELAALLSLTFPIEHPTIDDRQIAQENVVHSSGQLN